MKSNLIFSTLFAACFILTSCKKEEETSTADSKPKEIILPRVQGIPSQTYSQQPVIQNTTPVQQPVTNSQPVTTTQAQVVTKPGMNPPHGQPGHRCDIAVGMPLSTPVKPQPKPGTAITQRIDPSTMTTQTQTSQPTGAPAILNPSGTTATAPGMNPPHGQDGHRCDIAVGAPLPKS